MGLKEEAQNQKDSSSHRVESVLHLLNKQSPLSLKQERFCNNACVERFLKAKGESVKKAAKHLRICLSWRDSFGVDNLMADEFSHELAEGMAYVAGHDHLLRPVMIFRIKQDYQKFHSQKLFIRLLVFTLEVAVQTMAKNVEQFVLLFDASLFRSAPAFMNMLVASLKIIGDYYPQRLHKAFVIDPPSLFSYLWKGVRPFVELSSATIVVSSLDLEESLRFNGLITPYGRGASLQFSTPSSMSSSRKLGSCASSRFSFTVSHNFDSVKPWYLSFKDTPGPQFGPKISPINARSLSFASPVARAPRGDTSFVRRGFFPSTPMPQRTQKVDPSMIHRPRTPRPSFLQSPSFFRKDNRSNRVERSSEAFAPFLKFFERPYDEMVYRSKMRPPLGGLISIVSPQFRRSSHFSVSQRF